MGMWWSSAIFSICIRGVICDTSNVIVRGVYVGVKIWFLFHSPDMDRRLVRNPPSPHADPFGEPKGKIVQTQSWDCDCVGGATTWWNIMPTPHMLPGPKQTLLGAMCMFRYCPRAHGFVTPTSLIPHVLRQSLYMYLKSCIQMIIKCNWGATSMAGSDNGWHMEENWYRRRIHKSKHV